MYTQLKSVLVALCISVLTQAPLAQEGTLGVPTHIGQPVELTLPVDLTDPSDYQKILQVYVGKEVKAFQKPILGTYEHENSTLKFFPLFAFVAGQDYVIKIHNKTHTTFNIKSTFSIKDPTVTKIYPSGNVIPENTLRFYIHFSEPMKPHVAFEYIKLVDYSGKVDDAAFMKFKQELWNQDRKRLTVLMDPGRIKRGVGTNLKLGPALLEGRRYKLIVKDGWPTANGGKTLTGFSKPFNISNALRRLPDTKDWKITAPSLQTKDALIIAFDRPYDYELLQQDIKIFTNKGTEVEGSISISEHETSWQFHPNKPWVNHHVHIVVDGELEDVAGNNFKDLLDHSVDTGTKDVSRISVLVDLIP